MSAKPERLEVERLGGLAGFGQPGAHLRSRGELAAAQLSAADQRVVSALFTQAPKTREAPMADGFRYRLTRHAADGSSSSVEVAEQGLPEALRNCVKDELV